MDKFNVTDANGKQFEFTIDQLTDMDSNVFTREAYNVHDSEKIQRAKVEIVDSLGNVVDIASITDEEMKTIQAIDVTYEATHSGDNRNYAIYHSDSMEKDAESFLSPFPRPFLKNHDIESEPMGRVKDFLFGQSELNADRDTINVTWRITDKEAIPKFLDGRYRTMSIGASVGHIKCNICGKDILKDGKVKFCGHWKGESYNGQKALWHARDLEYREGSVVNSPADDWAQVKKITIVKEEGKEGKDNKDSSILDDMDDIIKDNLGDEPNIDPKNDDNSNEDNNNPNPENNPTNEDDNKDEGEEKVNTDALKAKYEKYDFTNLDSLISLVETLDSNLIENDSFLKLAQEENEKVVKELNDKITLLDNDNLALNTDKTTLNGEVEELKEKVSIQQDKMLKMAVLNKSLLVDKILQVEKFAGTLTDKEARNEELLKLTSKELNDMYNKLEEPGEQRKTKNVSNPGIVNNNDDHIIEEDDEKVVENKKTLKDIEASVINNILR